MILGSSDRLRPSLVATSSARDGPHLGSVVAVLIDLNPVCDLAAS